MFVLDTDTLSLWQDGHPVVAPRCVAAQGPGLVTTVVTVEEQLSGWYRLLRAARDPVRLAAAYGHMTDCVNFYRRLDVVTCEEPAIRRYEALLRMRLNVRANDLRIAAVALGHGATVVTRNLRDFGRVPGLTCVDWSV